MADICEQCKKMIIDDWNKTLLEEHIFCSWKCEALWVNKNEKIIWLNPDV